MYILAMPSRMTLPSHVSTEETARCLLLVEDLTQLIAVKDPGNESFEKSYRLCYNVCVHVKGFRSLVSDILLPYAIERAAMRVLQDINPRSIADRRAFFDTRVNNLQGTMRYWIRTSDLSEDDARSMIINVAELAWCVALKRVLHARSVHGHFLVLALMSSGLCCEVAASIKDSVVGTAGGL